MGPQYIAHASPLYCLSRIPGTEETVSPDQPAEPGMPVSRLPWALPLGRCSKDKSLDTKLLKHTGEM